MQQYLNAGGSCEFVSVTAEGQHAAIILIASEGCASDGGVVAAAATAVGTRKKLHALQTASHLT